MTLITSFPIYVLNIVTRQSFEISENPAAFFYFHITDSTDSIRDTLKRNEFTECCIHLILIPAPDGSLGTRNFYASP